VGRVSEQAVRAALKAREAAQAAFLAEVRQARDAGATIAELQEWTGYSRRTIFYMLKENTK
jgi:hypothetical protein